MIFNNFSKKDPIEWKIFEKSIKLKENKLLKRLDEFHNSILITGCQRSGTSMLAKILNYSDGIMNCWIGPRVELHMALILCGYLDHKANGRYCFQTTFLNDRYNEYYEHLDRHKIVWVLRNPFSVVYSMMYHWNSAALNRLFKSCGVFGLEGVQQKRYERFGLFGIKKIYKACLSYNGKISQLIELTSAFNEDKLMIVDYDELVQKKSTVLPRIYKFINIEYKKDYLNMIHSKSLNKFDNQSERDKMLVDSICMPNFLKAKSLIR